MKQTTAALIASAALVAPAFADAPVQLRARIEADGAAVTLGDVFTGTGALSSRPIAPAPAPGQVSTLGMDFLVAAAQSANLSFTPPPGVSDVRVVRPAGMRATVPAVATQSDSASATPISAMSAGGVRRGDTVVVTYQVTGLTLTARARAMSDGGVGQTIRLTNLTSNQSLDAQITGPGAARAN
jgi:hypothetical protein